MFPNELDAIQWVNDPEKKVTLSIEKNVYHIVILLSRWLCYKKVCPEIETSVIELLTLFSASPIRQTALSEGHHRKHSASQLAKVDLGQITRWGDGMFR